MPFGFRTMAEMGVLTRNEIRQGVGLDPLPGLDDPLTPMNMTTGDSAEADDDEKDELRPSARCMILRSASSA